VFDNPDRLIVDRSPNPHLAFGIGTHFCMGANLAKAEVRVVLEELFRRLPDIRRVDEGRFERGNSSLVLSVNELKAVFTPESAS
jgi:cytochrome P450